MGISSLGFIHKRSDSFWCRFSESFDNLRCCRQQTLVNSVKCRKGIKKSYFSVPFKKYFFRFLDSRIINHLPNFLVLISICFIFLLSKIIFNHTSVKSPSNSRLNFFQKNSSSKRFLHPKSRKLPQKISNLWLIGL